MSLSIDGSKNNYSLAQIMQAMYGTQNLINSYSNNLSTGKTVNSAADNPASYSSAQLFNAAVQGLQQSVQNTQNGISMLQTGSSAMNNVSNILQKMNSLATEAANGTMNSSDLANIQQEYQQLGNQINNIANQTQFNNIALFSTVNGTSSALSSGVTLQTGNQQGQETNVGFSDVSTHGLGIAGTNLSSQANAQNAMSSIQNAISQLSNQSSQIGSYQDQLNYTATNLANQATNAQNSQSTITDANMAQQYTAYTQAQVMQGVGTSMYSNYLSNNTSEVLRLLS